METYVQMAIKNKKNFYKYLMENSFWIKDLNRDGANFNKFAEYVKEKYRLRVSDKVSDAIDNVDLLSSVIDAFK